MTSTMIDNIEKIDNLHLQECSLKDRSLWKLCSIILTRWKNISFFYTTFVLTKRFRFELASIQNPLFVAMPNDASQIVQQFGHNIVSQSFLLHCLSLNGWKLLFFWRVFEFFSLWFQIHRAFDYFSQLKWCVRKASNYFYCFNDITVS